jgi:hypothetical protein
MLPFLQSSTKINSSAFLKFQIRKREARTVWSSAYFDICQGKRGFWGCSVEGGAGRAEGSPVAVVGTPRGVAGLAGTVLPPEIARLLAFPSQGYTKGYRTTWSYGI